MKKILLITIAFSFFLFSYGQNAKNKNLIKQDFKYADAQLKNMLKETKDIGLRFPRTINKSGKLATTNMYDWTSGFFPGSLWLCYDQTKEETLKTAAIEWTEKLAPLQYYTGNHDLGFMMYCSYGNGLKATANSAYRDILIQSAKSLCTRYNPIVGCIKSWNQFPSWHGNKTYYFPVIIDNMMNLELLFYASKTTGDTSFRHIAISHAVHTMDNQIRKNYSSFHVVCYDSTTGQVIGRETAQGLSDNSTWSRGQAWGIYGFTMCYRETKDERFLKTAEGMADYYLDNKNLPKDKVPYWDMNAGQSGYEPGVKSHANGITIKYRDASAAAIAASAFFELSTYSSNNSKKYYQAAVQILKSLSSPAYRAPLGTNGDFMIMHCVGSLAHGSEVDVPLVYADYYFLEALTRFNRLLEGKPVVGE
ncbi:MAG: glycoside hydrolase family 88 protein [Bacteroidetes bacterium]|nr:glycoside hydrolase family 88 protein [Bacteroidota bacterium]